MAAPVLLHMLCLLLQVVLSPQRPRTVISFENRVFSADGSKPVLTMFPHAEGAKVRTHAVCACMVCSCARACLHHLLFSASLLAQAAHARCCCALHPTRTTPRMSACTFLPAGQRGPVH